MAWRRRERAGLTVGTLVTAVEDSTGHRRRTRRATTAPRVACSTSAADERARGDGALTIDVVEGDGSPQQVIVERPAVWSLDGTTVDAWLTRYRFFPLAKLIAYTLAGMLVVALGASGLSARLMTMAFLLMGVADAGLLLGAERSLPPLAAILLAYTWLVAPFTLPMIGTAVLYFRHAPRCWIASDGSCRCYGPCQPLCWCSASASPPTCWA